MSKTAFITGITGQDGSYLAELLLGKGYVVHGLVRSAASMCNLDGLHAAIAAEKLVLHLGDLTDGAALTRIVSSIKPTEVYNLAAQSHVGASFERPEYTADVVALGTIRLVEAIKSAGLLHSCRLYQASTSELYGRGNGGMHSETTTFKPSSPYGVAKLHAYWTIVNARDQGMHASNGILFSHESPRRADAFVTRKITKAVARIASGEPHVLKLGNLDSGRDWGYAKDYVEGMWLMLQQTEPTDYVLATGTLHTVREFVELAFAKAGIPIVWSGSGLDEVGKFGDKLCVEIDPRYYRPVEVSAIVGDASKAWNKLGWAARTTFEELVAQMVDSDRLSASPASCNTLV